MLFFDTILLNYSFNCMGSRAEPVALIFSCQYISRVKSHAKIINFSLYTCYLIMSVGLSELMQEFASPRLYF